MTSNKKTARIAGLIYLIVVLSGIFGLLYVPSKLIVWDDASATVANIEASETFFRLGMVIELVCYTFFLVLPLVLYKLLKQVNKTHGVMMVVFAVVSVPITFINMTNKFAVLSLISGNEYLSAYKADQLHAQVMFHLDQFNDGNLIAQIFWALWLFPLGYLIFKSGFLPKLLGIFLMVGCVGYLLDFSGRVLLPDYHELGISSYITLPASIGEIGTCLWLLIMGVRENSNS